MILIQTHGHYIVKLFKTDSEIRPKAIRSIAPTTDVNGITISTYARLTTFNYESLDRSIKV
jgi:hypothetical protein